LRLPAGAVITALAVVGFTLFFASGFQQDPVTEFRFIVFAALIYGVACIAWLLGRRHARAGQWFIILAWSALVTLGTAQLSIPGFIALANTPVVLAMSMVGLPGAAGVALGQSALFLLLSNHLVPGVAETNPIPSLLAIWAVFGALAAVYGPAHQAVRQAQDYFMDARALVEEARERKVALEQALDDLGHANRQLALANERLAALRHIAEEAQKAKAAFVAKVSHEFRTPLNMIIGLVDLMVTHPDVYGQGISSAVLEDLQIVHRSCKHLSSMVNDVLALSQAEAGRLALYREWVNLEEIIDGALTVVSPLLTKKGLELRVLVPNGLPEVYCDKTRIRQVILNLVSNAVRFTESGGITVSVAKQDNHVVLSVADTGPGVSSEDAARIFEPFSQGSSGLWRDTGGSGLGLSISKQFVELHSGRIWLESELGSGATFAFELPISPPPAPIASPGRWISGDWIWLERSARQDLHRAPLKPRVLVCDPTTDVCQALGPYAHEVELVATSDLNGALSEARECPANVLIVNARTPDRLWGTVEQIEHHLPDTPIVACAVSPQLARSDQAGAAGYMIKPVDRLDLVRAIQSVGHPVKRILVVDDDPEVTQLFRRMLVTHDPTLEITTAASGLEALQALCTGPVDLVLLDVILPDMDGWQVLARKQQDAAIRDIPVVLVSAQDPAERPVTSRALLATLGDEISLSKLLRCSLGISKILLEPD
jgi:signal transduction histidine kinase/CheY-like chemotaxis protein